MRDSQIIASAKYVVIIQGSWSLIYIFFTFWAKFKPLSSIIATAYTNFWRKSKKIYSLFPISDFFRL